MAVWRGFPWRKVPGSSTSPWAWLIAYGPPFLPGYILAQLFGGIVGAALVYATYFHAIDIFEGGRGVRTFATAGIFATYPVCGSTVHRMVGAD